MHPQRCVGQLTGRLRPALHSLSCYVLRLEEGVRGVPRGAATVLPDRVWVTSCEAVTAIGVEVHLDEDAVGGGGCLASGREARAGGRVVEATAWTQRQLSSA